MRGFKQFLLFYSVIYLEMVTAPQPGTFFWKPRLGIDLSLPTTESTIAVYFPNRDNIRNGTAVMVDGYQAGITLISLAAGTTSCQTYFSLSLFKSDFYNNAFRWGLRFLSLIPYWMGGSDGHFVSTLKLYKRRFYYMDQFVPKPLRFFLPWVEKESWAKEDVDLKKFKKYTIGAFGKHFRFPSKTFNNFKSQGTDETLEGEGSSAISAFLEDK